MHTSTARVNTPKHPQPAPLTNTHHPTHLVLQVHIGIQSDQFLNHLPIAKLSVHYEGCGSIGSPLIHICSFLDQPLHSLCSSALEQPSACLTSLSEKHMLFLVETKVNYAHCLSLESTAQCCVSTVRGLVSLWGLYTK